MKRADGHFAKLAALLDLEAEAEQEAARKAAQSDTGLRDGVTLTGLEIRNAEFGLGGRLLLTFSRSLRSDRLPPNRCTLAVRMPLMETLSCGPFASISMTFHFSAVCGTGSTLATLTTAPVALPLLGLASKMLIS